MTVAIKTTTGRLMSFNKVTNIRYILGWIKISQLDKSDVTNFPADEVMEVTVSRSSSLCYKNGQPVFVTDCDVGI